MLAYHLIVVVINEFKKFLGLFSRSCISLKEINSMSVEPFKFGKLHFLFCLNKIFGQTSVTLQGLILAAFFQNLIVAGLLKHF
jgi:hypothetical protein